MFSKTYENFDASNSIIPLTASGGTNVDIFAVNSKRIRLFLWNKRSKAIRMNKKSKNIKFADFFIRVFWQNWQSALLFFDKECKNVGTL